ncbi:hypothetical protein PYCC9005_002253 [Savitreella phatthalungensis]
MDLPVFAAEAKCELLGPFALLVQASLGFLAVLSLLYKRHIERPRRPFDVWAFDVSKQLIGAVVVHFVNIGMSSAVGLGAGGGRKGGGGEGTSPCTWYFLNIIVDTTLGVALLYAVLKLLTHMLEVAGVVMHTGDYGTPPRWSRFLGQLAVFVTGLVLMKIIVFALLYAFPGLAKLGDWGLRWLEGHEKLRIFFVMFFAPLVMNIIQYVIIDNIVKGGGDGDGQGSSSPGDSSDPLISKTAKKDGERRPLRSRDDTDPERRAGGDTHYGTL